MTTDRVLPDFQGATFEVALDPVLGRDSVLVSDGRPSYAPLARDRSMLHIDVVAKQGERVYEGVHIQNVNAYASRLKSWMAPFKGVASKYLGTYQGWPRMIEREGTRLTLALAIAEAIGA